MFLFLFQLFNTDYFVLLVNIIAFVLKMVTFFYLFIQFVTSKKIIPVFFLLTTLFGASFVDFSWICVLMNRVGHPIFVNPQLLFIARFSWIFFILQYHSMI